VRAAHGTVSVRREPLTYERHNASRSYVMDLIAAETGHGRIPREEAQARLEQHAAEMRVELPKFEARQAKAVDSIGEGRNQTAVEYERRDLNRTDGTGGVFVPPLWAMSEYIDLARAGRVTANLCASMMLPGGTDSINIPKISTGTTVAIQTADNAAVSETDLADTSVSASVRTLAGQQDISLQALEQSPLSFDQIILADLAGDHAAKLDQQVISGSNTSGQVLGIRSISSVDTTAYTDASPTVAELYPKLADSWNQVNTTRFLPPEVIIMHPRRWAWIMAALDSAGRPFSVFQTHGPQNAPYIAGANNAEGFVGTSPFGPIYVDPNIPTNLGAGTNEDVIILGRPSEYYLWEGAVRTRVLTEVLSGNLTVRIQLYNYVAFMPHRRPESTSLVGGTGLVAPSF
jgi:HK97 family phage major capsid protein